MVKTGDIMVEEGLVCPEDVDQVLAIQEKNRNSLARNRDQLFGMVLCDLNLVTPMDNYCALEKHRKLVSVKEFLVRKNIVSGSRLDIVEAQAAEKDIPFISYLLEEQIVPKPLLKQILFTLFHIPFRSVSDIVFDEKSREKLSQVIDRKTAARHKIIPLQLSGNTMMVGITDPGNLFFLRELDEKFVQYRFTPIFILFSGFTWFFKMLYREDWESQRESQRVSPESPKESQGLLDPLGDRPESGSSTRPGLRPDPMDFSISITDPDLEREAIYALYERYETMRLNRTGKNNHARGRADLFFDFISQNHNRIARQFQCSCIGFSLKKNNGRLQVMAMPKKENR